MGQAEEEGLLSRYQRQQLLELETLTVSAVRILQIQVQVPAAIIDCGSGLLAASVCVPGQSLSCQWHTGTTALALSPGVALTLLL